jgi:hypothetical protein
MQFHVAGDYAKYFGLHGGVNDFVVGGWSAGAVFERMFHDGYHPNADTLTTARTIALSGAATGTATSFNGSANITIPVTALNASNLNAGTVPDARITGSYTGMTNLTGTGNVDFAKFLGNAADTITAPSYSWTGDTNTGMWRPGADQIGFTTNGVSRLNITTTAITSTLAITAPTFTGALSGNATTATTATTLQTARTINGTSFNGSANITTANWGTARTIWGQSINGSANITAPVRPAAGSVTAPAFSTSGDTNTGIYFSAADTLNVTTGGTLAATFASGGDFTAVGNITAYSDERLKSNIRTIDNALDKVKHLRGVYFDKDGKAGLGVIAQEVEKVIPEVVLQGDEYKSVAYGNIVGVLIEAIKEQDSTINSLRNDVETLKELVNKLMETR